MLLLVVCSTTTTALVSLYDASAMHSSACSVGSGPDFCWYFAIASSSSYGVAGKHAVYKLCRDE